MGLKIDSSYNVIEVKYSNAEAKSILLKGYTIIQECYKGEKELEEVIIHEGVKKIDAGAFENCTSLASITFPSSLKQIEWNSFVGCTALKEIIFPASLEEVDCWFDGRGVAKLSLFEPSSDELVENLKKGYRMDLHFKGSPRADHWD